MKPYSVPASLLQDKVILVTGAGQGLGLSIAQSYAQHGATVILLGRQQSKLEAAYDAIVAAGYTEPVIFCMDLASADEAAYTALAEGLYQQLGRLDGIVHNATQFDNLSPLAIQNLAQFETMFKVNVLAPFALTKACLPLLSRAKTASVIFTSTSAATQASAYWGSHGMSKAAADHMMQTWAAELENTSGIRCNSVVPGAIQTPQRKKTHPGEVHAELPKAEQLMPLYLYLMGDDSASLTGKKFRMDYSTGEFSSI